MAGILSIFKYCTLNNHIMWIAFLALSISLGALWYYISDKAKDEEEEALRIKQNP